MQLPRGLIFPLLFLLPYVSSIPTDDGRSEWAALARRDSDNPDNPETCCPQTVYKCCVASCGVCTTGHDCETVSSHSAQKFEAHPRREVYYRGNGADRRLTVDQRGLHAGVWESLPKVLFLRYQRIGRSRQGASADVAGGVGGVGQWIENSWDRKRKSRQQDSRGTT